jgi:acid phosphatase
LANDFGYITAGDCTLRPKEPCGNSAWELSAQADVIAPTLKLFDAARAKGVAIFFITGRPDRQDERAATDSNLRKAGYRDWTGLIMKDPGANYATIADFKAAERKKIEQEHGFTIIANVGDQQSDLDGGYAERRFKVPNPFYFIP